MKTLLLIFIACMCALPLLWNTIPAAAQEGQFDPESLDEEQAGEELEKYVYDPGDRRDPFVPLVELTPSKKTVEERTPITGTLEGYETSDFRLIAVASKQNDYYGLLLAPDNKSFPVKKGMVVGLYKGKVTEITPNHVKITEYTKDFKGELKPKHIVLELRKEGVE